MRGLKTLILRLTISTNPFEIYSFDNRTKYWKCCEPERDQVTRRHIRMEMENMENFTFDGNYTDLEPLYSLKDNVSRTTEPQSRFKMLEYPQSSPFIIYSITEWWISDWLRGSSLRLLRGDLSDGGAGQLHGHLHRRYQSSYAGLVMNYDSLLLSSGHSFIHIII